jgi:hypothetical protein
MENRLRTFEDNQKSYKQMVSQPLLMALQSAHPETALALLERGADPNVVTTSSQYYMQASWYSHFTGESALDLANKHLNALRGYKEDTSSAPSLPEGIDIYLKKFKEGTYQHWAVSKEIDRIRKSHRQSLKRYEKTKTLPSPDDGVKEKEAAIAEAIKTMEKVKEALIAKGAKTFLELHPEFKDRMETPRNHWSFRTAAKAADEPFKYTFSFQNVNDVTEARKEAYFKL